MCAIKLGFRLTSLQYVVVPLISAVSDFAMEFISASPSVIRSIRQRELLNAWLRLRRDHGAFPPAEEFMPAHLHEEKKDLVYYRVERSDGAYRFLIDSAGSSAARAYGTGRNNNIGTDLHDYLSPDMRPLVLPLYRQCVERGLPVYSIAMVEDTSGHPVICERLLLPFFHNQMISRIIASLKAISEDGRFEIENLFQNKAKLPVYACRAVIDTDLSAQRVVRDARAPAVQGDVIEI